MGKHLKYLLWNNTPSLHQMDINELTLFHEKAWDIQQGIKDTQPRRRWSRWVTFTHIYLHHFWPPTKNTYSEQIACQEDKCSSRVWESAHFPQLFSASSFQTGHKHTRAEHTNTKYSKRVMRVLTPSPTLPLSLILCYINYIFNEPCMVPLVSAPSIHGNCQLVPTIRVSSASTQTHCCRRNRTVTVLEWQYKIGDEQKHASV